MAWFQYVRRCSRRLYRLGGCRRSDCRRHADLLNQALAEIRDRREDEGRPLTRADLYDAIIGGIECLVAENRDRRLRQQ